MFISLPFEQGPLLTSSLLCDVEAFLVMAPLSHIFRSCVYLLLMYCLCVFMWKPCVSQHTGGEDTVRVCFFLLLCGSQGVEFRWPNSGDHNSGGRIQVTMLGGKHPYPLSHPVSPLHLIFEDYHFHYSSPGLVPLLGGQPSTWNTSLL